MKLNSRGGCVRDTPLKREDKCKTPPKLVHSPFIQNVPQFEKFSQQDPSPTRGVHC